MKKVLLFCLSLTWLAQPALISSENKKAQGYIKCCQKPGLASIPSVYVAKKLYLADGVFTLSEQLIKTSRVLTNMCASFHASVIKLEQFTKKAFTNLELALKDKNYIKKVSYKEVLVLTELYNFLDIQSEQLTYEDFFVQLVSMEYMVHDLSPDLEEQFFTFMKNKVDGYVFVNNSSFFKAIKSLYKWTDTDRNSSESFAGELRLRKCIATCDNCNYYFYCGNIPLNDLIMIYKLVQAEKKDNKLEQQRESQRVIRKKRIERAEKAIGVAMGAVIVVYTASKIAQFSKDELMRLTGVVVFGALYYSAIATCFYLLAEE